MYRRMLRMHVADIYEIKERKEVEREKSMFLWNFYIPWKMNE